MKPFLLTRDAALSRRREIRDDALPQRASASRASLARDDASASPTSLRRHRRVAWQTPTFFRRRVRGRPSDLEKSPVLFVAGSHSNDVQKKPSFE
jgi:hypothetical protein